MNIVRLGKPQNKQGEFHFICDECGCEWYANRGDSGLKISPPCCEFYAYMKCPNCDKQAIDEENKTNI